MQLCPNEPCHQQHSQKRSGKQNIKVQQCESVEMKSWGAQNPDIVINTSLLLQHLHSKRIRRKKKFEFLSPSSPSLKSRHGAKSLRAELRPYQRLLIDLQPRSNFGVFSWLPPSFGVGLGRRGTCTDGKWDLRWGGRGFARGP